MSMPTPISSSSYLLDTNAAIALMNRDALFLSHFASEAKFALPTPALGELFFGAQKSSQRERNIERVTQLSESLPVLNCDVGVSQMWGILKHDLHRKGRPIPQDDIWIAAIALVHGIILVTRDAHFGEVSDLKILSW